METIRVTLTLTDGQQIEGVKRIRDGQHIDYADMCGNTIKSELIKEVG